jgi:hypothetical protein
LNLLSWAYETHSPTKTPRSKFSECGVGESNPYPLGGSQASFPLDESRIVGTPRFELGLFGNQPNALPLRYVPESARDGGRTHTEQFLRLLPLPVGLPAHVSN